MKSFDVSIYGNLIVDNVYEVDSFEESTSNNIKDTYTSLGACANVIRELGSLNSNLSISLNSCIGNDSHGKYCKTWIKNFNKIYLGPLHPFLEISKGHTSNALVVSSLNKSTRTGAVKWGACQNMLNFTNHSSAWKHFMYIDKMYNLTENELKKLSKNAIISVDFCLGKHSDIEIKRIKSLLQHVDYVFISENEAHGLTGIRDEKDMALKLGNISKGICILHTPRASYTSNGSYMKVFETNYIEDQSLNVLGAGDVFCASFISETIKNGAGNIEDKISFAHKNTTKYLTKGK